MKYVILLVLSFGIYSCTSESLREESTFFENGKLQSKYKVDESGMIQGKFITYFEDGKIHEVKFYKNDSLNGIYKLYDENGLLKNKAKYKNNIQIDTSFFYDRKGKLEVYSVLNENAQTLKEVFFYPSGSVKKIKTFFVGKGKINAFQNLTEGGQVQKEYLKSKYALFDKTGKEELSVRFRGLQYAKHDSIIISYVEDFKYPIGEGSIILNKMKYEEIDNVRFSLAKSNYYKGKLTVITELYKTLDAGELSIQQYVFQFTEGQNIPENSLYPIVLESN